MRRFYRYQHSAHIVVVGVGGAGCHVVDRLIETGVNSVEYVAINTDGAALSQSLAHERIQIGQMLLGGLGTGGNELLGRDAAEVDRVQIRHSLQNADLVFVVAGMGGGTGTGAAPIVARIAREMGALTVAMVTEPFTFEGSRRRLAAERGIKALHPQADTVVVVRNDALLEDQEKLALKSSFQAADDVLRQAILGIAEVIRTPGLVNLDFADVKAVMTDGGSAIMGLGRAEGDNRALEATRQALKTDSLRHSIDGAQGVLLHFRAGKDITTHDLNDAVRLIRDNSHPDVNLIFGVTLNDTIGDGVEVTLIATGVREIEADNTVMSRILSRSQEMATPKFIEQIWGAPPKIMPKKRVAKRQAQRYSFSQWGGMPAFLQE